MVMTLKADVDQAVDELTKTWSTTQWGGTRKDVPAPDGMGYSDGKLVNATFLYADMANSSGLVAATKDKEVVASVVSAFLKTCVRIIRSHDGHIRSFDGDRVMGVFSGPSKETRAAVAALQIHYAVKFLLDPKIQSSFADIKAAGWHLSHASGIATSPTLMVRSGIRNNSDLVSIGVGPNLAAKLSDIRTSSHKTYIGAGTYSGLEERALIGSDKLNMWEGPHSLSMGGGSYSYYSSSYYWKIS